MVRVGVAVIAAFPGLLCASPTVAKSSDPESVIVKGSLPEPGATSMVWMPGKSPRSRRFLGP